MSPPKPEEAARKEIDVALDAAGWVIQDDAEMNLYAAPGVAVREFVMAPGHGKADYLLFVDQKAVGALSVLLERIRAEREAAASKNGTRTNKKASIKGEGAPSKRQRKRAPGP